MSDSSEAASTSSRVSDTGQEKVDYDSDRSSSSSSSRSSVSRHQSEEEREETREYTETAGEIVPIAEEIPAETLSQEPQLVKRKEITSSSSSRKSTSSSSSSDSEEEYTTPTKARTPTPPVSPPSMPSVAEREESLDEEAKQLKKVQITDETPVRPKAAHPKSARFYTSTQRQEPVSTELHVIRNRKTRSAPVRSHGFHAQSSNLVYLQKECNRIERKMAHTAKAYLVNKPKVAPYKPFVWNSLAPYYNTDTLRYIINMPVPVRRGFNTRATASGLVDPEVSWRMDHCLTPTTPSRPELFRHHYVKSRARSAVVQGSTDDTLLKPRFPKVTSTAYGIAVKQERNSPSNHRTRKMAAA